MYSDSLNAKAMKAISARWTKRNDSAPLSSQLTDSVKDASSETSHLQRQTKDAKTLELSLKY
jgi:hypothetical protein